MKMLLLFVRGKVRCLRAAATFFIILWDYKTHRYSAELDAKNARRLYRMLTRNGGTWIKAGQFLSTRPDILSPAYIDALTPLQSRVERERPEYIVQALEIAYGADWRSQFAEFELEPIAGASIAVVHKATLLDGSPVALKIKRKDIDEIFAIDLRFYRLIVGIISLFFRKFDLMAAADVFLRSLQRELDFQQEAKNVSEFASLKHIPGVRVPQLVGALCNEHVVVMEWIDAQPLLEYLEQASHSERDRVITLLKDSYLQQILRFGVYQGDPHPGNFMVDAQGQVVFLDFGLLLRLEDAERVSYVNIMLALIDRDVGAFSRALSRGGVTNFPESEFSDKLVQLISSASRVHSVQMTNQQVEALLKDMLSLLNKHAVSIPEHFLVTGRVLITLTGLFRRFDITPRPEEIRKILFEL